MSIDLKVPEVGESIHEVQILRWLKSEGDWIDQDEDVVEIETEKATVAIPAPQAGRLEEILKDDGDFAEVGDTIGRFSGNGSGAPPTAQAKARQQKEDDQRQADESKKPEEPEQSDGRIEEAEPAPAKSKKKKKRKKKDKAKDRSAEPQVAEDETEADQQTATDSPHEEAAREKSGRGVESQPTRREPVSQPHADRRRTSARPGHYEDPRAEIADKQRPSPAIDDDRPEQVVPMSMLRRTVARRLVEAQQNAALLTTFNEIDMQEVIDLRRQFGEVFRQRYEIKLGFMSFFVKAAVEGLKKCPELNAEVRGNDIIYRGYYDVGVAIGSRKGLVVPVVRDCHRLSFAEIERQIAVFAERAENDKLSPDDLQGGTFTISNGGVYGSLLSTPIVNPPQSGVLGLHAIEQRPVARDGQVVIRPMMYVALTYDHRLVDGREAVGFLGRVKEILETPARLFLEV